MSYFTGMNNMLCDGHPLYQYDEDELTKILERENREKEELEARLECLEREVKQIHLQNLIKQINEVQSVKNELLQHADAAELFISNSHKNFSYLTPFFFQSTHCRFFILPFYVLYTSCYFYYVIFNNYLHRS